MVPFALKAGTIGKLELKVRLMLIYEYIGEYFANVEWTCRNTD